MPAKYGTHFLVFLQSSGDGVALASLLNLAWVGFLTYLPLKGCMSITVW
jgi:hypothetical protein